MTDANLHPQVLSKKSWCANFNPGNPTQMHKLYSDYVHPQRHLVVLPDDVNEWFIVNHFIPDAPGTTRQAGDIPSEKVICTLQLNKSTVLLYCNLTGPFPEIDFCPTD
jgi:hypothetical protein